MSTDPPPPTFVESRLDQYSSPSHLYATRKIDELKAVFPRNRLSRRDRDNPAKQTQFKLWKYCLVVKKRSDWVRLGFNHIISGTKEEPIHRSERHLVILRDFERNFYLLVEIPGSHGCGWNYLHDHNWEIITENVNRLFGKRHTLVSASVANSDRSKVS